jgi:hypothetical protein
MRRDWLSSQGRVLCQEIGLVLAGDGCSPRPLAPSPMTWRSR